MLGRSIIISAATVSRTVCYKLHGFVRSISQPVILLCMEINLRNNYLVNESETFGFADTPRLLYLWNAAQISDRSTNSFIDCL